MAKVRPSARREVSEWNRRRVPTSLHLLRFLLSL